MSEILFTRPGSKCKLKERLIEDIKDTKFRICMAMAYFTDKDIYNAMHESTAPTALFILNEGDVKDKERKKSCSYDLVDKYDVHTVILGDEKFSKMHHKFIILDNIAYIGSYNFSYPASGQNWEFMIRVTDGELVKKIEEEFWIMWFIGSSSAIKSNKCVICNNVIEEPISHYTVTVNYNVFRQTVDPRQYVKLSCGGNDEKCSCCNRQDARVKIIENELSKMYCYKCAGNMMNKVFINNQMYWESDNIYYDELAIWYKDIFGDELIGTCGKCGKLHSMALVNEIKRVRRSKDNPFGIEIGRKMNICDKCYSNEFLTGFIMEQI